MPMAESTFVGKMILRIIFLFSSWLFSNSMEYHNGQPVLGHAPARAHGPTAAKFPDFRLQYPRKMLGGAQREFPHISRHEVAMRSSYSLTRYSSESPKVIRICGGVNQAGGGRESIFRQAERSIS